jgi:hypothetical protein
MLIVSPPNSAGPIRIEMIHDYKDFSVNWPTGDECGEFRSVTSRCYV